MPSLTTQEIISPAQKVAKNLSDFYLTEQNKKNERVKEQSEQQRNNQLTDAFNRLSYVKDYEEAIITLFESLDKIDKKYSNLFNALDKFDKTNQLSVNSAISSLRSQDKTIGDMLKNEIIDLRNYVKNKKISYFELANKPILLSKTDVQSSINRLGSEILDIIKDKKISYKEILDKPEILNNDDLDWDKLKNKPDLLTKEELENREKLIGVRMELVTNGINELKLDYRQLDELCNKLEEKIGKLTEEDKKIIKKIKDIPNQSYSGYSSYGEDTVTLLSKALKLKVNSITADYPASTLDYLILGNATSGNITVTLPPATNTGLILTIKKTDSSANTVTIQRGASDTIEGETSISLSRQYTGYSLIADGAITWYVTSLS